MEKWFQQSGHDGKYRDDPLIYQGTDRHFEKRNTRQSHKVKNETQVCEMCRGEAMDSRDIQSFKV